MQEECGEFKIKERRIAGVERAELALGKGAPCPNQVLSLLRAYPGYGQERVSVGISLHSPCIVPSAARVHCESCLPPGHSTSLSLHSCHGRGPNSFCFISSASSLVLSFSLGSHLHITKSLRRAKPVTACLCKAWLSPQIV